MRYWIAVCFFLHPVSFAAAEDSATEPPAEAAADTGTAGDDASADKDTGTAAADDPAGDTAQPAANDAPADDPPAGDPQDANDANILKDSRDKTSYAIGVSIGRGLKADGADVDGLLVGRGIADVLADGTLLLDNDQIRNLIVGLQKALRDQGAANSAADATAFLEANQKKEGVVTTDSGLQYRVLQSGDGPTPKATDRVKTHYRGTLIDGTEFDSSYRRNEPSTFGVGDVIKGWTEALQLMKVGDKWELVIPPELGYGDNPRPGGLIKPGDVLVFEIELLGIEP